jgi:hypothetical protein
MVELNGTKEKFEVEIEGKKLELVFRRPTLKHRREFLAFGAKNQAEIKKAQEGKSDKGYALLEETITLKNKILTELCENGGLKSPDDFDNMASEDVEKLWAWFDQKIGVVKSKEESDFLDKSAK